MKITLFNNIDLKKLGEIELETLPEKDDAVYMDKRLFYVVKRIYSEDHHGLMVEEHEVDRTPFLFSN